MQEEYDHYNNLLNKKRKRLNRLLELYLDGDLPKPEYLASRKDLDLDIADAKEKLKELKCRLDTITLTPERITNIHEFAQKVRTGLNIGDNEENFDTRRRIINLLDVKAKLVVENEQKIVYASCILNIEHPEELCLNLYTDYTNTITGLPPAS